MRLSHSKLSLLINNPMEYFLSYKMGIQPKIAKTALSIGSAVHWGLEHNTDNLSEYYGKNVSYGHDEFLAEAMAHGYLCHKEQIFDELLAEKDGSKLQLLNETHELFIDGKLPSFKHSNPHIFVGIIDLLLLTDKGWVIVDYKTSSKVPDWNGYLDQLYRYIFLVNSEFPDIPVNRLAIINLRKSGTKQARGESWPSYSKRLRLDYELNDDNFINWHVFNNVDIDKTFMQHYIDNLSRMADLGELIDTNNAWYCNYSATNSYGGSVYKSIIDHIPDCHVLYTISDDVVIDGMKVDRRDCKPIDMLVIDKPNILNKYKTFKEELKKDIDICGDLQIEHFFKQLKDKYICDDNLLSIYLETAKYELATNSF